MKPSGRSVTAPSGGWERPHGSRATVILFVAAALAGCGGSGETRTVTTGAGAAGGPRTTTGPAADASGASGKAGAATGPALAERDGKVDGVPVHLELAELKRASGTTTLLLDPMA